MYFVSVNDTDRTLSVPLNYPALNQILSVTGEAVPIESFSPGTSGFSIPESYFTNGQTLLGIWRFLGQEISVKRDVQVCADRGVPGQCNFVDPVILRSSIDFTRNTILKIISGSMAAAKSGKWKGKDRGFSLRLFSRGARALAYMERTLPTTRDQTYSCEVVPMSCSSKRVPKEELAKQFTTIFSGKVPRGLEHVFRQSKNQMKAFQRLLKKLPDTYVTCDSSMSSEKTSGQLVSSVPTK